MTDERLDRLCRSIREPAVRGVASIFIVAVTLAAVLAAAGEAGAQTPFTEEAIARGLIAPTPFGGGSPWGQGLAAQDLDGDGDPDLIVTGSDSSWVSLWVNDGGDFFDVTVLSGLPLSEQFDGVCCADYDGDGDIDVYLTSYWTNNALYRNEGGLYFTEVTGAGVDDPGPSTGACWGDYDGDGWLDLYAPSFTSAFPGVPSTPNRLYHNLGDGTFEEVAGALGVDDPSTTHQALFVDYDRDGDLDLYVANDIELNRLWRNDGGSFTEVSSSSGADLDIAAMGIAAADIDRDGDLDLFVTDNDGDNDLLLNDGDGTFTDATGVAAALGEGRGWGATFLDYDNDGVLELYSAQQDGPNALYEYPDTFPFEDVATPLGVASAGYISPGDSFCTAKADVDLDGDLDLFVQSLGEPIALYINNEGTNLNYLRVRLHAEGADPFAVGAMVTVRSAGSEQWQQLFAGTGFKSSEELVLHFGLAGESVVDELLVRWPDRTLSLLTTVAANQVLDIYQASEPPVTDCDGDLIPDSWQIAANPDLDADGDGALDDCGALFRRGDANADGDVGLADAISILLYQFGGGPLACADAADVNDDGLLAISDPIYLLDYSFLSGPALPPPGPDCGIDESPDALSCDAPCP